MGRADSISFTFTTLDVPGATSTALHGINGAGQIVGSYTTSANTNLHGFLYSGGSFTTFDAPSPQAIDTTLSGINDAGQIVGTLFEANRFPRAFKLDSSGFTVLDFPNGSQATGINNHGQIVGGFFDAGDRHGFVDTNGVVTAIDVPGVPGTLIQGINGLGQLILNAATYNGFLYSNGVFTDIGFPGTRDTSLFGINDAGQIVGLPSGVLDPINGFIPISLPGARSTIPSGINNVGQIVGGFVDSSGVEHGFIATPVPEAASVLFIAAGLLATMLIGQRRVVAPS